MRTGSQADDLSRVPIRGRAANIIVILVELDDSNLVAAADAASSDEKAVGRFISY